MGQSINKSGLTPLAPDWRDSAAFSGIFYASSFSCSQAESTPARQQVKPTVGQPKGIVKEESTSAMDWYCPYCLGEGKISYNQTGKPVYVICSNCSRGDAYVWCEKCGTGGQIAINDFNLRPSEWVCEICERKYKLPANFYDNPITFAPIAFSANILRGLPPSKKFANVSPIFLKKFLIYWNSYREKFVLTAVFLFIVLIVFPSVHQPTLQILYSVGEYTYYLILFALLCLPAILVLDILSWIIEKIVFWNKKDRIPKMK